MPAKDIYGNVLPKRQDQSDADYDSYLTNLAKERLLVVNDNSVNLFKNNLRKRMAENIPATAGSNQIAATKPSVSDNSLMSTAPMEFDPSVGNPKPIENEWQNEVAQLSEINRIQEQQRKFTEQEKNSKFLNEVSMASPNLKRQAELEYNKGLSKAKKSSDFQNTLATVKQANPGMDDVSAYQQAVGLQSQQDLKVFDDIKRYGKNTFDQIIGKPQLEKIVGDDEDERDYLNSDKFKYDTYTAANGNPSLMPDMAKEIIERRKLEKESAPTRLAEMQKGLYDALYKAGEIPGLNTIAKPAYALSVFGGKALQTMGKIGALGASTLGAMDDKSIVASMIANPALAPILPFIAGNNQLSETEKKGGFLSRFAQIYGEKNKDIQKYIPEARSEGEDNAGGIESTVYNASRLMGELSAVGLGPEIKAGTKLLSRATRASKARDLANAYGKLLSRGGTSGTINTASNLTRALSSVPANLGARFVDNYLGVFTKFGPIVYDNYYQSALDKGYKPEEAAQKALFKTSVNAAAFSLINPFKSGLIPKNLRNILGKGSVGKNLTDAAVQFAKDAGTVGIEGTIAVTADAYQDFLDAKEQGLIPKDQPFDYASAVKEGLHTIPAAALAIATGRMANSHGVLTKPSQSRAIADAIENRSGLDTELRRSISKGMPVAQAAKLNGFMDAVTPGYREALDITDANGNPLNREQAVQYGVEKAKFSEAMSKFNETQQKLQDVQIGQRDGVDMPMANENGVYSPEAYERLTAAANKYKTQAGNSSLALRQIVDGTYTKGQIISSEDLLGKMPAEDPALTTVQDNGPYESSTTPVEQLSSDPIVQERITEIQSNPETQLNTEQPVVVDVEGKVISGHDTIAESILNGDPVLETFAPAGKDKINAAVTEDVTGELVNKEGLDRDQSKILDEIKQVFDDAKGKVGQGEAFSLVASDILERGYTKDEAIDRLIRVVNGEVSRPVAEFYYNEALKKQNVPLETISEVSNNEPIESQIPQESTLTIEENGFDNTISDRSIPIPEEVPQEPSISTETTSKDKTNPLDESAIPKIDEVFKGNPEISEIGTPSQYAEYLSTIFPESIMRDVVYHRSNEKFDDFDFSKANKDTGGGFDFAVESGATQYGNNLYPVLLDIGEFKPSFERTSKRDGTTLPTMYDGDIYSVYHPEQIHILGSKSDISGFRDFISSGKSSKKVSFEFAGDLRSGEVVVDDGDNVKVRDSKGVTYTIPKSSVVNDVAQTVRSYESVPGLTPQTQPGRIPVSPILGGEPKMLRNIIFDVTKSVKQRLFYAKPQSKGALATYSPGNSAIKIRYEGDLDATAHELGHSMDDIFGIMDYVKANPVIENELSQFSQYGSTPPAGHLNPSDYILREGLAEWTRAYIVNPDVAKQNAPEMYKLFSDQVETSYKEAIENFSKDVRSFAGSTGKDMILSNVEWKPEKKSTIDNIRDLIFNKSDPTNEFNVTWADRLAAKWVNPLRAFEKAAEYARGIKGLDNVLPSENPEVMSRLLLGINGKTSQILESGMIDSQLNVLKDINGNPKNLKWLLEPFLNSDKATIEQDIKDAISYMIAERTVELGKSMNRQDILTGIGGGLFKDVDVAEKALQEFRNDPDKLLRIQEATNRYRSIADDILKYMVDKGRLSQEDFDSIKKNNTQYVALKRVAEISPTQEVTGFSSKGNSNGLGSVSNPLNSIKGSTKTISNPYLSLLDSIDRGIRESDRNEVLKTFRDLLVSDRQMGQGEPTYLSDIGHKATKDDPNTIQIFVDGKSEYWQFQNDIYKALKGLNDEGYKFPKMLTALPRILRASVTNWPIFAVKNFIRDTQARMIMSNESNSSNLFGLKELFGDKEHWKDVERAGGLNAGLYMKDKSHYYGLMERAIQDMTSKGNIVVDGDIFKRSWDGYKSILSKSETSNRVAEYRSAFKKAKSEGLDDYNAQLYAAYRSRDLLDFALMGDYMKYINQLIPFSNAAVQGARSTYNRAVENPKSFGLRATLFSVLPAAAIWLINHRDAETSAQYEELPDYQKDMFYNVKIGPNNWLSIPKPYEAGMIGSGISRTMSLMNGNSKSMDGYAGSVAKSLFPFNEGNFAGPLQPLVELSTNHDYFRDKSIVPAHEEPLALELRNTEKASRLGKSIQSIAGLDARKADHLIKQMFSYYGSAAMKVSDLGREDAQGFDAADLGLFKQSPAYNSKSVQDYMKYAAEYGLTSSRNYKEFKNLMSNYFDAKTNQEKENASKVLIDYAQSEVNDLNKMADKKLLKKERENQKNN